MVTSIVFRTTYGLHIKGLDDEFVTTAENAVFGGSVGSVPGAFAVEFVPLLRHVPEWFPGGGFWKVVNAYRPSVLAVRDRAYDDVKRAHVSYIYPQFFTENKQHAIS